MVQDFDRYMAAHAEVKPLPAPNASGKPVIGETT
jgi:hypothetical protein